MIRALLFIALALVVPALAPLAIGEKGYVLIGFNNYTIEGTIRRLCSLLLYYLVSVILFKISALFFLFVLKHTV